MADTILVVGANGTIGRPLVQALLAKGAVVRAASRTGSAVEGAEGVVFNVADPATFPAAFEGVDAVYLLLPAGTLTIAELLLPLIAFAAERKVKVVLQSVLGADASEEIPYRQAELALERSGTPFVILRPNWFADNFHTYWKQAIDHGMIGVPAAEGKTSFIDARDIGESAAAALTDSAFDGRAFDLTGPEALSYDEAATVLSAVLGRQIRYTPLSDEAFIAIVTGAGVPKDYAQFLAAIFASVRDGGAAVVTGDVAALTGHAPRDLATYAADNRAAFR